MTFMRKKIWIIAGSAVLCMIILLSIIIRVKMGALPSKKELSAIQYHTASEIYSADSVLIGRYFTQNRTSLDFEEIPEHFLNALIATEDARFFEHRGVDYRSLGRVLIKTLLLRRESAGGGSTLSQQLAKNLYPRSGSGVLDLTAAKIREAIIASRLEKLYSKDELLTLYLNTVSFGEDVYGLETASIRYFSKPPMELLVQESAVLVGMLKATTSYNPRLNPEQAKIRRNTVLSQMEKYGYLGTEESDSLSTLPVELHYQRLTNKRGTAPYFKAKVRPMLDSLTATLKKPDGTPYNLNTDGLRIILPIDSRLQSFADSAVSTYLTELQRLFDRQWAAHRPWDENPELLEAAVKQSPAYQHLLTQNKPEDSIRQVINTANPTTIYTHHGPTDTLMSSRDSIAYYLMLLQAGMLAIEPSSGEIKAWVGGLDFGWFQYDHVLAHRQVGSTFKPIVYAAALEKGLEPCDFFRNKREIYGAYDNWSPRNADGNYQGYYSLKGALAHSVNTVSAQVIMETGISHVIELAHRLGIQENLPQVPSLALGTADLNLLEMVSAYAAIANGGVHRDPVFVLQIATADGEILWQHERQPGTQAMSESSARLITNFMQAVVDEGTASSLRSSFGLTHDIAGKTGTTQSSADGWFIGYTPEIVAGVWVGADNPAIHFQSGAYGQGARMALPVWALFMQQAIVDPAFSYWNSVSFAPLDDELAAAIDCPLYTEKMSLFDRLFGVKDRKKSDKEEPLLKRLKNFFGKGKD